MENNHRFFRNHGCKYFPCHKNIKEDEFNCLFCYCPLYAMGDKCGGVFEYVKDLKICTNCHRPHNPDYYDIIIAKLKGTKEDINADAK